VGQQQRRLAGCGQRGHGPVHRDRAHVVPRIDVVAAEHAPLLSGRLPHHRGWWAWTLWSTPTSPTQMIVWSAPPRSYRASIIARSAPRTVANDLKKTPSDSLCPRCRSDQIQVVSSGASRTPGPAACAVRIRARVCRSSTIGWTGGARTRSSSSMYSACSRSAAASGTLVLMLPFSGPTHGASRAAGSAGATLGSATRTVSPPLQDVALHRPDRAVPSFALGGADVLVDPDSHATAAGSRNTAGRRHFAGPATSRGRRRPAGGSALHRVEAG